MSKVADRQAVADRLLLALVRPTLAASALAAGAPALPAGLLAAVAAEAVKILHERTGKPIDAQIMANRVCQAFDGKTVATLKEAILIAAGAIPEQRTPLEDLAKAVNDRNAAEENTLLREAVLRLFRRAGKATDDPAELASLLGPDPFMPSWPDQCIRPGAQTVTEPFCGRRTELGQIADAWAASRNVIAVVGMAGQGKSSLLGQWWIENWKDFAGRALFWCRPYDADYPFTRFLADALVYMAAGKYDLRKRPNPQDLARDLCDLLRQRPTILVLDGLERWLKRWADEPDADAADVHRDDRLGFEDGFDILFADAPMWTNGSALLFTSRAMPAALDGKPVARVGTLDTGTGDVLDRLDDEAAAELLGDLGVKNPKAERILAAQQYDNHPLALSILGQLVTRQYGGDLHQAGQVDLFLNDPTADPRRRMEHLLDRLVEHHPESRALLTAIAACLGPAPLAMLAALLKADDRNLRQRLGGLQDWNVVRFDGRAAEMHSLLNQYFRGVADASRVRDLRVGMARWFAAQPLPASPYRREDASTLIRGVEHALATRDLDLASDLLYRERAGILPNVLNQWLDAHGHLPESVRLQGGLATVAERILEQDPSPKMRDLLAMVYNNRGGAHEAQGNLAEAVEDYDRAAAIRETLVNQEGRRDLRSDLAKTLMQRGLAHGRMNEAKKAGRDMSRAAGLVLEEVSERKIHLLPLLVNMVADLADYLVGHGKSDDAARWANTALLLLVPEAEAKRMTSPLEQASRRLTAVIARNLKAFEKTELDAEAFARFLTAMGWLKE